MYLHRPICATSAGMEDYYEKKTLALTMAMALVLSLAACGNSNADVAAESTAATTEAATTEAAATEASTEAAEAVADEKSEGVMTYEEYMAADLDSEVVIEAYVQAKQSWWEDKATLYTQDQMVLTSSTIPYVPKRIMLSWYPVPRSK